MDILILPPHAKLNTSIPQNAWIYGVRVRFQIEEIVEKSDGGGNTKESFTKMNKNRQMQDGVRVQMVQGYTVVMQKPM